MKECAAIQLNNGVYQTRQRKVRSLPKQMSSKMTTI